MQITVKVSALVLALAFLMGVSAGHLATKPVTFDGATIIAPVNCQETPSACVDAKTLARDLLTAKQYKCLNVLLNKESNWRPSAVNKGSGSTGIGQLLPKTWRTIGMTPTKDGVSQMVATLAYISRHYGTGGPCAAWQAWKKNRPHHY